MSPAPQIAPPVRPRITTSRCACCGLGLIVTLKPADPEPPRERLEALQCLRCQIWPAAAKPSA